MAEEEKPKAEDVKVEIVETPKPPEKPVEKPPETPPAPKPAPLAEQAIDVAKGEATPAQIKEITAGYFFTIKQLAQELGYGTAWIIALVKRGRIKAMKPTGGQWRIAQSEVERLRTEGIPPLPRKPPELKPDSEIVVTGKHEERVRAKEKKEGARRTGVGFPLSIMFPERKEEE